MARRKWPNNLKINSIIRSNSRHQLPQAQVHTQDQLLTERVRGSSIVHNITSALVSCAVLLQSLEFQEDEKQFSRISISLRVCVFVCLMQ